MYRIDTIIVQPIVTNYDDTGKPVHEQNGPALKLFRASQPDVWALLDAMLDKELAGAADPTASENLEVTSPGE